MDGAFDLAMPWWQFVLRAAAVYIVLLVLIRLSGKRTMGQFTPKMPLFNFTKLSELAIKYKFPLTITAQETLGTLKLTEEALVAQIQALEVNEFLARAVVPEIDFGTLYEDIKIKFRKAVSTKPYVPAP